ncbi:hypothetical protein, partial [Exiguobacterium sp. J14376]
SAGIQGSSRLKDFYYFACLLDGEQFKDGIIGLLIDGRRKRSSSTPMGKGSAISASAHGKRGCRTRPSQGLILA